jgi:hypothetical protein
VQTQATTIRSKTKAQQCAYDASYHTAIVLKWKLSMTGMLPKRMEGMNVCHWLIIPDKQLNAKPTQELCRA